MLHPLEHIGDHQNPLADTPTLVSCQAPQLSRPRFVAEKVCRHPPPPKHSTLAYQLYHIWGSPEAGIIRPDMDPLVERAELGMAGRCQWRKLDPARNPLGPALDNLLSDTGLHRIGAYL